MVDSFSFRESTIASRPPVEELEEMQREEEKARAEWQQQQPAGGDWGTGDWAPAPVGDDWGNPNTNDSGW